jgi:hypothetical protein
VLLRGRDPAQVSEAESLTLDEREAAVISEVKPFTMLSAERLLANMDAISYVVARDVPGAVVECGVWRGGSTLAMIRRLQQLGQADRDVYMFDTFTGMTKPTEADTSDYVPAALQDWEATPEGATPWPEMFGADVFDVASVRRLMRGSGYPADRVHVVQGPVEETIPQHAPARIAVLRLDTDWYESTRHELVHLYPRLSEGGVLIIDDYGHWQGARKAVDEFVAGLPRPVLLHRVDYTGRVALKF